jgi:hypothetical protein
MSFLQSQGVPLKPEEINAFQDQFRVARQYAQGLPAWRDKPETRPMEPHTLTKLREDLESEATFREHTAGVSRTEIVFWWRVANPRGERVWEFVSGYGPIHDPFAVPESRLSWCHSRKREYPVRFWERYFSGVDVIAPRRGGGIEECEPFEF